MTTTIIAFAAVLLLLGWLLLGGRGRSHEPTLDRRPVEDIDRAELEEAEREVQEAPDAESVRDWGPGASRPRPPELL